MCPGRRIVMIMILLCIYLCSVWLDMSISCSIQHPLRWEGQIEKLECSRVAAFSSSSCSFRPCIPALVCFIHFWVTRASCLYLCNGNFLIYTKVGRGVGLITQSKQLSAHCVFLVSSVPTSQPLFLLLKANSYGTFYFVKVSLYQHAISLKVKGPCLFHHHIPSSAST